MISMKAFWKQLCSAIIYQTCIDIPAGVGYRPCHVYSTNENQQLSNRGCLLHLPTCCLGTDRREGAAKNGAQSWQVIFFAKRTVG